MGQGGRILKSIPRSRDDPDRIEERFYDIVPESPKILCDMHRLIHLLLDEGKFLEVQERFAKNRIIGFGRLVLLLGFCLLPQEGGKGSSRIKWVILHAFLKPIKP